MKNVTPDQDIQGSNERTVLALVMWYVLVIDHLKRMFSNPRDFELLLWHVNCKTDRKIRHPTDGRRMFSNDPRNIKFGLSTDEMNPFREMRNQHNT
jgi:hypothetical protein